MFSWSGSRNIGIDFLSLIHPVNHIKGSADAKEDRNRNAIFAWPFSPLSLFLGSHFPPPQTPLIPPWQPSACHCISPFLDFVCQEIHAVKEKENTAVCQLESKSILLFLFCFVSVWGGHGCGILALCFHEIVFPWNIYSNVISSNCI